MAEETSPAALAGRRRAAGLPPIATEHPTPETWSALAFGLKLNFSFQVPGLFASEADSVDDRVPETVVDLASAERIDATWPKDEAKRTDTIRHADGRLAMTVDDHPRAGYRLQAPQFGLYRVAHDGGSIRCAPPSKPADWNWQRLLLQRILPLAATLRGCEVFHASAVAVRGRAVGIVGAGGTGKTSLAIRLMLLGARLITDDVLAIRLNDGELLAYPGPGIVCVRPDQMRALSRTDRERLGETIGWAGKAHIAAPRVTKALPLSVLYVRVQSPESRGVVIERMDPPNPAVIIGSIFTTARAPRDRLINQLNVCAAVADRVPVYAVAAPAHVDAPLLATAIHQHAISLHGVGHEIA